ncbi:MAG: hypothetical protein ABJE47_21370 [bacterium]
MSDRNFRGAAFAALLIGLLVGCSEHVTGSLGCPALCSDQSADLRDTTLSAVVVLDTTFAGFPHLGDSRDITLLNRGDTADVRIVARYDSLPSAYFLGTATADSTIRLVDSAVYQFRIDSLVSKTTQPITIDAFDVDTTASDTVTSALVPLFRPDRLLGSRTFQPAELLDTLRLPLNNAKVFAKVRDTLRLRIGLRVRGTGSVKLAVLGNTYAPRVIFRVSADTSVHPDTVLPRSKTPANEDNISNALSMFPVVAAGALARPPIGTFTIGGISGSRSYLRFDIPTIILDSVQVIRASLILTQRPARGTGAVADSVTMYTQPVLAAPTVTDIFTAATFLGGQTVYGVDTLRLAPRDSGLRSIELVNLVRFWKAVGTANASRSIVFRSPDEGRTPGELSFYSMEGPTAVRPKLRLTYVPRRGFGIP